VGPQVKKLCVAFIAQRYHSIDNLQEITQDPDGAKLLLEIMDQVRPARVLLVSLCCEVFVLRRVGK
jgi:hypothetical protein